MYKRQIAARAIVDRDVDVHPAARLFGERLGHEGRLEPMLLGDRFDPVSYTHLDVYKRQS